MWPTIKYEEGIGIKFKEDFWEVWGPSSMFYYNDKIFDDSKDIKSIYLMYNDHMSVKFDKNEIAMGLKYQCGEFGEHTVLFSYVTRPKIENPNIWNHYVFPYVETDQTLNEFYQNNIKRQVLSKKLQPKIAIIRYMENYIFKCDSLDESIQVRIKLLSKRILTYYQKYHLDCTIDEAYYILLSKIYTYLRALIYYENNSEQNKQMYQKAMKYFKDTLKKDQLEEIDILQFEKMVFELLSTSIDANIMKKIDVPEKYFEKFIKEEEYFKINDLNSIFKNCREIFKEMVELDCNTLNECETNKGFIKLNENNSIVFTERQFSEEDMEKELKDTILLFKYMANKAPEIIPKIFQDLTNLNQRRVLDYIMKIEGDYLIPVFEQAFKKPFSEIVHTVLPIEGDGR